MAIREKEKVWVYECAHAPSTRVGGSAPKLRAQHVYWASPGFRLNLCAPDFPSPCPSASSQQMWFLNKMKGFHPEAKHNRFTSCEPSVYRLNLGPKPLCSIIYDNSRKYVLTNKGLIQKISRCIQDLSPPQSANILQYCLPSPSHLKVWIWSE